jgi:hypothetical protein
MADGRELIEETYQIIINLTGNVGNIVNGLSADEAVEFKSELEAAMKWVKLCRDKVWLRGKQGTDMAQDCLDSAKRLEVIAVSNSSGEAADAGAAVEGVADLSLRLETLARLIASKVQVLT